MYWEWRLITSSIWGDERFLPQDTSLSTKLDAVTLWSFLSRMTCMIPPNRSGRTSSRTLKIVQTHSTRPVRALRIVGVTAHWTWATMMMSKPWHQHHLSEPRIQSQWSSHPDNWSPARVTYLHRWRWNHLHLHWWSWLSQQSHQVSDQKGQIPVCGQLQPSAHDSPWDHWQHRNGHLHPPHVSSDARCSMQTVIPQWWNVDYIKATDQHDRHLEDLKTKYNTPSESAPYPPPQKLDTVPLGPDLNINGLLESSKEQRPNLEGDINITELCLHSWHLQKYSSAQAAW